ncbi:hypothetical protein M758_12G160500 [Ceratodon purpureus]|nr:hypothetical protein M758_12G160500 [Ceratodon purpureus]
MLITGGMDLRDGLHDNDHNMPKTMSAIPLFQVESHRKKRLCLRQAESAVEHRCLDKRYKIFLSHAGAQKNFVEQLYIDLQRVHHFGIFFDIDDASLPKGENFPSRIFEAAKHCELAIVVMSDEYFTRKWPMLELKSFLESKKERPELKILPVFYKLSIDEFRQQKRQRSYKKTWNKMSSDCQWEEVVKVISSTNGIHLRSSEPALRNDIVKATFKLVTPHLLSDDSNVQGKTRISKIIEESFQRSNDGSNASEATSVCFVGLYGMGGSGKTTMSKVLCNNMIQEFLGKVCRIEFGAHGFLDLCKQVIRCTTNYEEMFLSKVNDAELALQILKDRISDQRIFLVIDNVNETSSSEAKTFLGLPFKVGSLILVTARSITTLENLNISWRSCVKVPALQKEEAVALLTQHAGCDKLSSEHKETLGKFVDKCCFNVEDWSLQEYHPLALKVLGTRMGPDPREWCKIVIDFKHPGNEGEHPLFSILRSSYDTLRPQIYQMMFMDLILGRNGSTYCINSHDMAWRLRYLYNEETYTFIFELLEEFRRKSLIECYNLFSGEILVHDLYREFVQMEVEKDKFQHHRKCCLFRGVNQRYKQAHRLRIYKQEIQHLMKEMLCSCSESELLTIEDCSNLKSVDVRGMQNLKMLEIVGCPLLKNVVVEGLANLRAIIWKGFEGEYPSLVGLESLEGLIFVSDNDKVFGASMETRPLDLSGCPYLDVLELWNQPPMPRLPDFNLLKDLRILMINRCAHFESFLCLHFLKNLVSLQLYDCSSLLEFPSLANFEHLEIFTLEGAFRFQKLNGFERLTALKFLSLKNAGSLQGLPGIEACTKIRGLDLSGTSSIQNFIWISSMLDLEKVNLSSTGLSVLPDCSKLYKLEELCLDNCMELEGFTGSGAVGESLLRISMWKCSRLTSLPQLKESPDLTHLKITRTSIQDLSALKDCFHLQYLDCAYTPITRLPDMSHMLSLKRLNVRGCVLLTRLDNITCLPALDELFVQDCENLVTLPDLRSSMCLMELDLTNCPLVDPDLVKLPGSSDCGEDYVDVQMEENDGPVDEVDEADGSVEQPITTWWGKIMEAVGVATGWATN